MDNYQLQSLANSLNINPAVMMAIINKRARGQSPQMSVMPSAVNFDQAFNHGYQFRPSGYNDLTGQCFTAGHLVEIDGGLYKEIQKLDVGDLVLSSDGKTLNKVLAIIKRESPVIKLKTSLANFEVTKEHPFLTSEGFTEAQLLDENSNIVIPTTSHEPSGLTDNELKWLGFWLGDGDVHKEYKGNSVVFRLTVSQKKSKFVEELNIGSSKHLHSSHKTTSIHALQKRKHKLLATILRKCFDEDKEKQLPLIFNKTEYSKIIEGYLAADGYQYKDGYYELGSVSRKLLYSIQKASLLSGYHPTTINLHKRKDGDIFINGKKVRKIKQIYRMYIDQTKTAENARFIESKSGNNEIVYNITVDGDNTYICNNHAVHNCAWFAEQITRLPDGSNWTIGNTIQEKLQNLQRHRMAGNAFLKGEAQPEVGQSVIINSGGKWGHVAVVSEVLPDGRLRLTESNWNNDLRVTHDRIIDPNDNEVIGFLKTKPTKEFNQVAARTNPATPTTPKKPRFESPPPQNRQELPVEQQPVKQDDLERNNPNAIKLQKQTNLDRNTLSNYVRKPANNLEQQTREIVKPQVNMLNTFAKNLDRPMSMNQPAMSMNPVSPIKKPPVMTPAPKQFNPPVASASKSSNTINRSLMSMQPKQSTPQTKPSFRRSLASKIKGFFS